MVATLDLVRAELVSEAGGVRAGVLSDDGWSPWLTALLARVEIGQGDRAGLTRLRALAAAGAGVWPELIGGEPRVPVDLADHHPPATAAFLLATRALLLVERGPFLDRPDRLAVLPVAVPEWYGQGLELHDAPTAFGPFGFAVRWHGDRPGTAVGAGAGRRRPALPPRVPRPRPRLVQHRTEGRGPPRPLAPGGIRRRHRGLLLVNGRWAV